MQYDELKSAIRNLEQSEQKRLIMEVIAEMLPRVCTDEQCLTLINDFVNEEAIRSYREQNMDGI